MQTIYFVVPGDINTRTGGYRYDKRIIEGLRALDWTVHLLQLQGDYPFPSSDQRNRAATAIQQIPDNARVVIDALAYSTLPEQLRPHQSRLRLYALVHHPLALETGISAQQASALKAAEIKALQLAHRIITTSQSTSDTLRDYHVDPVRVSAICPGTDAAPLASGSTTDTFELLCVATLTARKGHSVLFDALKRVQEHQWHLNCVGSIERDTQTYEALVAQREELGLHSRISFTDEANDSALEHYYNNADLFVLASFHEGYGMVLDEAIARGLPIVASNAGAMTQTVPAAAGLLVPPGQPSALANALHSFMSDEALRTRLRNGAMSARQNRRSWEQASQEFGNLLEHD